MFGVEGGELGELHGEAAGGAVEEAGEMDDFRVALVHATEGECEVKCASDAKVIEGPESGGRVGHALVGC